MPKFLRFEISIALKDRPTVFRIITLSMLSFSGTVILISSFYRLYQSGSEKMAVQPIKPATYTGYMVSPTAQFARSKK